MCAQPPEYVTDMLSETTLKRTGYFDPAKVQRLTAKCRQQDGRLVSERESMALVVSCPPSCWTVNSFKRFQLIEKPPWTTPYRLSKHVNPYAIAAYAIEHCLARIFHEIFGLDPISYRD